MRPCRTFLILIVGRAVVEVVVVVIDDDVLVGARHDIHNKRSI